MRAYLKIMALLLVVSGLAVADENQTPEEPSAVSRDSGFPSPLTRCREAWKGLSPRTKALSAAGILGAGTLAYYAPGYKNLVADAQGKKYLGFGIMLDMEGVRAQLSPEEKQLLENPQQNATQVVELFSGKLNSEKFEPASNTSYFNLRDVSSLMDTSSKLRGRGRHKAVALWGILNELGIGAEMQVLYRKDSEKRRHVISIPSLNLTVDFFKKKPVVDSATYWETENEKEDPLVPYQKNYQPSFRDIK